MYKIHRFILPLFVLAILLVGCNKNTANPNAANTSSSMAASVASARAIDFDGKILTGLHTVTISTSKGDVVLELNADAAPKAVTNFIALARSGYYDGLTFHRIIPTFMVQGGDPKGDGTGGESVFGPTFEDEISALSYSLDKKTLADLAQGQQIPPELQKMTLKAYYEKQGYVYNNTLKSLPMNRGAIAMANRGPNTNGSQFFIVQGENINWLEGKYTVFGKVTKGMEVVDTIAQLQRDENNKPLQPVTLSVKVDK
ncbi:MAG: peptidyl-prolyl cis-trans isomerase [Candidatus Peribacteria bacterium]|nr:peptidyl-prolyl cis-trans isomerase [Candidatus Peribacteria bacterium]